MQTHVSQASEVKCFLYLGKEPDNEASSIFCCSCNVSGHSQVKGQRQYFSLCPLAELGKLEELLGTEANLQVTEGFER